MTVLIVSAPTDGHVFPVAEELMRRGVDAVRCDIAEAALSVQLDETASGWQGTLMFEGGRRLSLEEITAIWWRRPRRRSFLLGQYPTEVVNFLERETGRGYTGLLCGLGNPKWSPLWVSRPDSITAAERKPTQLAVATALGLTGPRTLLTTDPEAVRSFYEKCDGRMIIKAIARGVVGPEQGADIRAWKDVPRYIYTSRVRKEDLSPEKLEGVRAAIHCFQEEVVKALEVRVIVIGQQVFAVGIDSQRSAATSVDWRRNYANLHYQTHELPQELTYTLLRLVKHFQLQFSAIDLVLTPEGRYVFLESNPNGQFLWRTSPVEHPLKEAMVNLLTHPEEYALQ